MGVLARNDTPNPEDRSLGMCDTEVSTLLNNECVGLDQQTLFWPSMFQLDYQLLSQNFVVRIFQASELEKSLE